MPDLELVRRRFARSLSTYDENAHVQAEMARHLCDLLPARTYARIFEVGCGTGLLTRELLLRYSCSDYSANDLVPECGPVIQRLLPCHFFPGNMDTLSLPATYDLIISNAALQWSSSLPALVRNLFTSLNPEGILAFSLFGPQNLHEIKEYFGVGLSGFPLPCLRTFAPSGHILALEENSHPLNFARPLDILRHLKRTGVNSFGSGSFSRTDLRFFEWHYSVRFGCRVTYHPQFVVLQKN